MKFVAISDFCDDFIENEARICMMHSKNWENIEVRANEISQGYVI